VNWYTICNITESKYSKFIKMDVRGVVWEGGREGGVDRIDLAQDRDRWRALVNAIMNLLVL
jgi:hypothetical protein